MRMNDFKQLKYLRMECSWPKKEIYRIINVRKMVLIEKEISK